MANRMFSPVQALDKGMKLIAGSFQLNGTNNPINQRGTGFSVTRTGVGTFQVKLTDAWPKLDSITTDLQLAAPNKNDVQVGAVDLVNKTITMYTIDTSTGAAVDIAADPNNRVNFSAWFKNSSVVP